MNVFSISHTGFDLYLIPEVPTSSCKITHNNYLHSICIMSDSSQTAPSWKATLKNSDLRACDAIHVGFLLLLVFPRFTEQQVLSWANPLPESLTGVQLKARLPPSCCQSRRYSRLSSPDCKWVSICTNANEICHKWNPTWGKPNWAARAEATILIN